MLDQAEIKKRKACNACTKAKAKCSPFGDRTDLCQRCERLNKECVYQDSARRRGPRQRGRMKQLEQRVESLVSLLEATRGEAPSEGSARTNDVSAMATTVSSGGPSTIPSSVNSHDASGDIDTPPDSPESYEANVPYDPIASGLISEFQANTWLNWYRESFVLQFPFVIVDPSLDANALRQQQPFLFLSIMAATASSNPMIQRMLGEAFKDEVAARVIVDNHKGMEILQGLLIHTAYYNHFYMPGTQQMAIMLQLCIAIIQDLGDPKSFKADHPSQKPRMSMAEKRARLGTYFVAAWFSNAWRRRTTMPYTRALARLRQSFVEQPSQPSDHLIPTLIDVTELMCQINDYFSYDEIEDSEVKGDAAVDLAAKNFRRELQRLRDRMSEPVKQNGKAAHIDLLCDFTEAWIYECSLHSEFWHISHDNKPRPISSTRARVLQQSFSATQSYLRNFLAKPSLLLHEYPITVLSGWFYSTLVILKLIFLHANNGSGALGMGTIHHRVPGLLPKKTGDQGIPDIYNLTTTLSESSIRDEDMAAREAEILPLFAALIDKFTAISAPAMGEDRSLVMRCCQLQEALLAGLKKRMDGQSPIPERAALRMNTQGFQHVPFVPSTVHPLTVVPQQHQLQQQQAMHVQQQQQFQHMAPGQQGMTGHHDAGVQAATAAANYGYVESMGMQQVQQAQQASPLDTWMWDLVMEDVNMFTM